MKEFNLIINGESVGTTDYFDVVNPADKSVIARCPKATTAQLNDAVAAARSAFPTWSALTYEERRDLLMQLADAIEDNGEELMTLLTKEQGKPTKGFADLGAGFEFGGTLAWIRATASMTLEPQVIQDNDTARIELHRKPLGVVGSITPWNYPLLIGIWHIIPALLTGNTVVMKPSEMTPLTVLRFGEIAKDILPAGVLNIVTGEGDIGAAMTSHQDIQKIVFTGSTPTGKAIMKSAADNLTRLTLELGGNDAGIVLADADIAACAPKIFATSFINNGQTCAALKRLYVHESVHDELCEALTNMANSMKTGNGFDEDTDFGPLQNQEQLNIVKALAKDAKERGANFLCGGDVTDESGYFYPITLVSDINDGARLVDEEQFGPILPIIKFSDVEEAIDSANRLQVGLGGSVWSQDIEKAQKIASRLECGTVWINNHAMIQPDAPFGGVKDSGFGVEFGEAGLKEFTFIQTVQTFKS
ncbi:aldehyde dehydrogenase family protein [Psychrobacter sp. Cmf 22.2]|uniref:aldehyde dehydrogenase family protein n=1 Tax=Psychrobacter sp. Cmf 22.2 TaxID=1926478 RepID=UPI0009470D56|nr:aldehyde dehydrogenase family protein [Psychrobacter sp. Cmf 22.2]OLF38115.1 aldehyde dehydrogenase [Psychrobacter sp. Cmf 22.2]